MWTVEHTVCVVFFSTVIIETQVRTGKREREKCIHNIIYNNNNNNNTRRWFYNMLFICK